MRLRAFVLLALAGCASAEAMSTTPATAPSSANPTTVTQELGLHPGETMTFEVTLGGVVAGEAELAVGEVGTVDGHRRVKIHSRAATAGAVAMVKHVVDESTTELELDTGLPVAFEALVENGDKKTTSKGSIDGKTAVVTFIRSEDNYVPKTYNIDIRKAVEVHDGHSAMATIRGWRAPVGTTRSLYVLGGRRLWRVDTTYAGGETIFAGAALGDRPAVKLVGKAQRVRLANLEVEKNTPVRNFTVYLSDDADRVPLKVVAQTELGDVVMALTDYARP